MKAPTTALLHAPLGAFALGVCTACIVHAQGSSGVPSAARTGSPSSASFEEDLRAARARRAQLEALAAPPYQGDRSNEDVQRYMKEQLTPWVSQGAVLQREAIQAYVRAATRAAHADAEMRVFAEAIDMDRAFAERFVAAGVTAEPSSFKAFDVVHENFVRTLRRNAWRDIQRNSIADCVARADALSLHDAVAEGCRRALLDGDAANADKPAEPARATVPLPGEPIPKPAWSPTRQTEPCVFAGTVQPGESTLFADATADRPIASVQWDSVLRVTRLELPPTSDGRYKVTLEYPVRATAWLDARARPIALRRRVDVVAQHLWVEPGTPESASRSGADRAAVALSVADANFTLEAPPLASPPPVHCEELGLAGEPKPQEPADARALWLGYMSAASLTLFEAPGASREMARLHGAMFLHVREHSGAFTRVLGHGGPVAFDGWVRTGELAADAGGMIGSFRGGPPGRPHKAARGRAAPVRLQPDRSAAVVFELAPDAEVRVQGEAGDFYGVAIAELNLPDDSTRYFIERSALEPIAGLQKRP